jgi:hypothetical protein
MAWTIIYRQLYFRISYQDVSRWRFKIETARNADKKFDKIIVGDSSADAAFVPRYKEGEVFNMSLGGGTPIDAYYYLKTYLSHHSPPKKVIISFSALSFQSKEELLSHCLLSGSFDYVEMVKAIFSDEKIELSDLYTSPGPLEPIKNSIMFNKIKILLNITLFKLYLHPQQINAVENIFIEHIYKHNLKNYNSLLKNPGQHIEVPVKNNIRPSTAFHYYFKMNLIYKYHFIKMIELVKKYKIRTYIIFPPFSDVYLKNHDESSYSELRNFYNAFEKENFIKFDSTARYYPRSQFDDSFHVTEDLAIQFCNEIQKAFRDL